MANSQGTYISADHYRVQWKKGMQPNIMQGIKFMSKVLNFAGNQIYNANIFFENKKQHIILKIRCPPNTDKLMIPKM